MSGGPFFVGWALPPRPLAGFLAAIALGLLALFGLSAYLIAATADDPGDGAFRFDWGQQTIVGVVEAQPYPVLHVLEAERFPAGHSLMLSGAGKIGVQSRAEALDGAVVQASGIMLTRGDLDMLQVGGGANAFAAAEDADPAEVPEAVPLGRWRLTGEICDGKCYAGAMRPGDGLAHRACANLCLIGGVPPVFVATDAVDGSEFFLMADADGGPVTEEILAHTALLVEVEGEVERRGGLHVFRISPETLRLAR